MVLLEPLGSAAFRGRGFRFKWLKKNRRDLTQFGQVAISQNSRLDERFKRMNALQLASALEQTRSIPLEQIASVAMDHKRKLAVVQLHSGTELQMEVNSYPELIERLTELYSGRNVA